MSPHPEPRFASPTSPRMPCDNDNPHQDHFWPEVIAPSIGLRHPFGWRWVYCMIHALVSQESNKGKVMATTKCGVVVPKAQATIWWRTDTTCPQCMTLVPGMRRRRRKKSTTADSECGCVSP